MVFASILGGTVLEDTFYPADEVTDVLHLDVTTLRKLDEVHCLLLNVLFEFCFLLFI